MIPLLLPPAALLPTLILALSIPSSSSFSTSSSSIISPHNNNIASVCLHRKNPTMSSTSTALSSDNSYADSNNNNNCPAKEARSQNLFTSTPLLHSVPLSSLTGRKVYLKLDCLQPSGSFKDRGMAHLLTSVQTMYKNNNNDNDNNDKIKVISSSGGNAGLAVTTVARNIPEMSVTVIVPQTTKPIVIQKLQRLGANVTIHGSIWNDADGLARRLVEEAKERGEGSVYVSPYDDPLLWTGHSTVVDEIISHLLDNTNNNNVEKNGSNTQPEIGAVLASVGGGGLLCGILEGVERNYYSNNDKKSNVVRGTKIVACETEGAASFAASFHASSNQDGEINMVRLKDITSVATSLGALEVTSAAIERSHRHQKRGREAGNGQDVLSYVCTDNEAIDACIQFAADHRILVEPACGASLAPLYSDRLRSRLLQEIDGKDKIIVVEICGGSAVSLDLLEMWKQQLQS